MTSFDSISHRGGIDDLILKVMPPRAPRHFLTRGRLFIDSPTIRSQPLIVVQAPAGFGKTSLLVQWRLEHLAQGTVVAWLSSQEYDEPQRLVQSLALAFRTGAGRPNFCASLFEAGAPDRLEAVTIWLSEVAETARKAVLIIDEANRLPPESRAALSYLLHNMPPNLRAIVAARSAGELALDDLVTYGQCTVVGTSVLQFQPQETLEFVQQHFGAQIDQDLAAQLHEMTGGWPLGLQLAVSVVAGASNPAAGVAALAAQSGTVRQNFFSLLFNNLAPEDVDFLTRIAILDNLHPDLCAALVGHNDALARLEAIGQKAPVLMAEENSAWWSMHNLARDEFRRRFAGLPEEERGKLHTRAAQWLLDHGQIERAAEHALAAGQMDLAYELAEHSLYDSFVMHGRQNLVWNWLAHLPADEIDRRPRLLLAAAWSLALSERHDEASRLVAPILAQPNTDDALRCECALILGGAAVFADDPDEFARQHDPWANSPPLHDPSLLRIHANRSAFRALLEGEPALARLRQQQAPRSPHPSGSFYVGRWGEFIIGLTYLWEGQVMLVEQLLLPALAIAEADLGRRNLFTCMIASVLAAALWERQQPTTATALLANRLDVLERSALPETVMLAYRTLARIAWAEGAEHRAMELLAAMFAVGIERRLPRLCIASLAEEVRLNAHHFRAETCRALSERIDTMMRDPSMPTGRLWRRQAGALQELAHAYAAIAAKDWPRAIALLEQAGGKAQASKLGRLNIEIFGLRAYALHESGTPGETLLREAIDLAKGRGLLRVLDDAHPALGAWARECAGDAVRPSVQLAPPTMARTGPSSVLTPKERQVLELLARSLSNKEIGLALQVGEETVKWHVKNLLAKLNAGTRKQAVQRANLLGFLAAEG